MTDKTFGRKGWTPERLGSLAGKTYVITGTTTGTGFQATRVFLSKGARVVMMNRNAEKAAGVVAAAHTAWACSTPPSWPAPCPWPASGWRPAAATATWRRSRPTARRWP